MTNHPNRKQARPRITSEMLVRGSTKNLSEWFDGDLSGLSVGDSIGSSDGQGAHDRWPVFERGERVGTLYDDATGLTYSAVDDDGNDIY